MRNNKGLALLELVILITLLGSLAIVAIPFYQRKSLPLPPPTEGTCTGVIVNLYKKYGWTFLEGELLRGGKETACGQTWKFIIPSNDETLVSKVQEAMNSGKRVMIHYEEPASWAIAESSTNFHAKEIHFLE